MARHATLGLVACALLFAGDGLAEEWLPRYAPDPGTRYRIEMVTRQTGKMEAAEFPGAEMAMTNRMEVSQWLLGTDDQGNSRVAWVYERVIVETDVGGQRMAVDTGEQREGESEEVWDQMIGRELVLLLSPEGDVLEIEKLDELLEGAFDDLPDGQQTEGLKQMMIQSFGEDQIRQMMQMSTAVYPDRPVGVGDSWRRDFDMSSPAIGKVRVDNLYRATGVEDGLLGPCLAADVSTEMEFDSGGMLDQLAEVFRQQGAEVGMQMDIDVANAHGDLCIDLDTGLVARWAQKLDFVMNMSMSIESGDVAQDLQMKMTMDVEAEVEVVGAEPLE